VNENPKNEGLVNSQEIEYYKLGSGIQITLPKDPDKAVEAWKRVKPAMDMILGLPLRESTKESTKHVE
jgi:hypothetical protein